MKTIVSKLLRRSSFFERIIYRNHSFAQEGEDLIIAELFNFKRNGFFVDVGAHHPFRFSNTFLLKKLGWKGINIEPNPQLHKRFEKNRKDDINLNCGVSSHEASLTYYEFEEPALNTFSEEVLAQRKNDGFTKISQRSIPVKPLNEIISENSNNKSIDFLSIDVEGMDFEVLKSFNWEDTHPKCILIEDHEFNFHRQSRIDVFLKNHNYDMVARTLRNSIYWHKE